MSEYYSRMAWCLETLREILRKATPEVRRIDEFVKEDSEGRRKTSPVRYAGFHLEHAIHHLQAAAEELAGAAKQLREEASKCA